MSRDLRITRLLLGLTLGFFVSTTSLTAAVCQAPANETYSPYYCDTDYQPCAPCENECNVCDGCIFGVEGLYWTVLQNNLDYAVDFLGDDVILGPGKTHFLDYDWKPGGRGFLGFVWNNWDVRSIYTWYENNSRAHTNNVSVETDLKASLLHPATDGISVDIAHAKSDLEYKTIDLLLGRELSFCERSIVLHPFFGARALQLIQEFRVTYENEETISNRVRWNSDLNAIGLHSGLDMYYQWGCNFGLYGSFAGSILASKTKIHHEQETLDDGEVVSTEIDLKEKQKVMIPGYQLAAGLSWDTWCGQCFHFRMKIGYEFNQWFDTPFLRRYHSGNEGVSNSATAGDIGFHGATLSLDFKF